MLIVKAGGGKNINWDYICSDFASLVAKDKAIMVHGASGVRDELAENLGSKTKTVVSPSGITSVYTDKKALDIFLMAYAGLVNKKIVAKLISYGVNAVGLSGVDGLLWQAKRKKNLLVKEGKKTKLLKNNYTGKVENINTKLILILLDHGYIPVVCPPAISRNWEVVNVDNDLAISVMAEKMKATQIVSLFEAPGLLKDKNNERSLIKRIKKEEISKYLKYAKGTMQKKIIGAQRAIEAGVEKIFWSDGRVKNPIKKALAGRGTVIT